METTAEFSEDRVYRYRLTRTWGPIAPLIVIGLNPSTADETTDDPTIRRLIGFAKAWRHDGLIMLNLFALRATSPKAMLRHDAPIGEENDRYIVDTIREHPEPYPLVIAAWGNHGKHRGRDAAVQKLLASMAHLRCLGTTKSGQPRHPLYCRSGTPFIPFY